MIEGVGPISAVEPVTLSLASAMSSRQGVVRREKRLRWLKSLNAARGGSALLDEEDAAALEREEEDRALADMRARLATTLSIVEALGGQIATVAEAREILDLPSTGREQAA